MWKMVTFAHIADIQEIAIQNQQEELSAFIASLGKAEKNIHIASKILVGTPHTEIIRETLRSSHDLVMIAARMESRVKEMLFGTTVMHLIQKCPCPVWVMRPAPVTEQNRILAFVNPDPFDSKKMWLSAGVIEIAVHLASIEKSELHITHIWTKYPEHILYCYAGVPINVLDNLVDEKQKSYKKWIYSLLNKRITESSKCHVHFLEGETETLIPKIVREVQAGLIVSGIIPQSPHTEVFSDSTVEETLHETDCSIITVKPEGFVTPVKINDARLSMKE